MGFDLQTTRFLFEAKAKGVDFTDSLTLGRQDLHIDRKVYRAEVARFGLPAAEKAAFSAYPYSEGLLLSLGAERTQSLDASHYEDATYVSDMNLPLPQDLHGRFSAVIDGGTLEHVFDFRQAAINVGALVRVGGHFISVTVANNYLGHGFYQFSPELFFRVFAPQNGFEIESLVLCEVNADGDWYEIADPAKVQDRVTLVNDARTYMMMRARKTADVSMFATTPQQSDYSNARWQEDPQADADAAFLRRRPLQRFVETWFPPAGREAMRRLKRGASNPYGSPHLTKVRQF